MVKIQSLHIKDNDHLFKDLKIDLEQNPGKIVALVGPNGCGKSAIFDFFESYQAQHLGKENINFEAKWAWEVWEKLRQTSAASNITFQNNRDNKKKTFYVRSPYRYIPELNVMQLGAVPDMEEDQDRPGNMRIIDRRLLNNFSLLQGKHFSEFKKGGDSKVERKFISEFNACIENILEIQLHDTGNILQTRGQFYFKRKNGSDEIPYNLLSSGEKEVVDIILDLIVKVDTYNDTVFCIDEPELHISTAAQRILLSKINEIIPETCQLWIATHSVGFLRSMQEDLRDESQIIDFSKFPPPGTVLKPIQKNSATWRELFHVAIDDLASLIAPETIVYCEGSKEDSEKMDALVYQKIFDTTHPSVLFVNAGGRDEMEKYRAITLDILNNNVFVNSELLVLKDRDQMTDTQRNTELENDENMRVLMRREIENYLFDWNVVNAAYPHVDQNDYDEIFAGIDLIMGDMKSKIGEIKELCGEHNRKTFFKNLAGKISSTENRCIFEEIEEIIFSR